MDALNKTFETKDPCYVMPCMGKTLEQMGCIYGKRHPHQGRIHYSAFEVMRPDDMHISWDYDALNAGVKTSISALLV